MMNLSKTVFLSGLAVLALAVPAANAQRHGGSRMSAGSRAAMASRLGATPQTAPARQPSFRSGDAGQRFSNGGRNFGSNDGRRFGDGRGRRWGNGDGGGRRWGNGDGRWHGRHGHWRHRYYPRYYYSGFYPYGFGYPYGYGYGYGYPYYGASANLYYNGTGYASYQGRGQGSGNLVVAVQQELARAGYYRGAIDGVIGDGTRRAIRAYERANGLPVDGRIDDDLLSQMGVG
jgi:hypothetical protein